MNMIIFFINRSCFIDFNDLQLRFLTILLMIAFISFYILWKPGNLYYILPGTSCASRRSQFWRTFTLSRYLHLPYIYIYIDAQVVKYYPKSDHHSIDVTIISSGTYINTTPYFHPEPDGVWPAQAVEIPEALLRPHLLLPLSDT